MGLWASSVPKLGGFLGEVDGLDGVDVAAVLPRAASARRGCGVAHSCGFGGLEPMNSFLWETPLCFPHEHSSWDGTFG
jgi:hypothetical protein